jgi:hemolysin activation/secretion protein
MRGIGAAQGEEKGKDMVQKPTAPAGAGANDNRANPRPSRACHLRRLHDAVGAALPRIGARFAAGRLLPLAAALLPAAAAAQAESVDPGQLERRFQAPPAPRAAPIVVPEPKAAPAPPEAARIRFTLTGVRLEGATVFAPGELEPLWAELLGREVSLAELYRLAGAITARYGNAGYPLARALVPAQTIDAGQVRLAVVEGHIDQVVLEGAAGSRRELLEHHMGRLKEARPLNAEVMERYLLLANDLPGLRLQSVLRPSADESGAASLMLSASRSPWSAALSLDNRGSRAVGPWQALVEASANDLLGRFERSTVRLATTPAEARELRYLQLAHEQVVNGEGTRLEASLAASRSRPGGESLRVLEVQTRSDSFGLSLSHPLVRGRTRNLSLEAGFAWRDSRTLQLGQMSAHDRLSVLRAGFVADLADLWGGLNLVALHAVRGLDALGARVESRAGARPGFSKIELSASRQQPLSEAWSATVRLAGQGAHGSLPASEQFGLGGEGRGRGYDPSEWTGDRALTAEAELAYALPGEAGAQLYGFYDRGVLWRAQPQNQPARQAAASTGLGVRAHLAANTSVNLEAARPLDRRADGAEPGWRGFVRLVLRF